MFNKYSTHHSLSANTGFKSLAFILFEILHLQNCDVKFQNFQRAITKKISPYNLLIVLYQLLKVPSLKHFYFPEIFHLRCLKYQKKGNNSKLIKKFFFSQNFTKYFSRHPLSADTSFKFLSLILFEIWHLQNFISIFSKGRNFTRGDNSKKKNTRLLFFHEESIHEVSSRYLIPEYHRCKISGSKILKKGNNSKNII